MKSYTDRSQSKVLVKMLPIESADCYWEDDMSVEFGHGWHPQHFPCWSLTALLKYLSEIKPQVYTPILFPSEGKWILQFVEYGHGNVCEVSCDNPVDACYEMILKLNELNLL